MRCYNEPMSNTYHYGYDTGSQRSIWYYLVFPVDAWSKSQQSSQFEEIKETELKPILMWFMPLLVLIAGFTLGLGFFSSLFFYGCQAVILALMCKVYLKLDGGNTVELLINFWVSFLCIAFALMLVFAMLFIFI